MANKRMFSKKITDTDTFLDMPLSAQALYFHLNMHADDDGFLANAQTVRRMTGASNDDFKLLLAKEFLIQFEDGITVVKDWRVHNYIRKDTYATTIYKSQKALLDVDSNGSYTVRQQSVDDPSTQVRLGKVRLDKSSKDNEQPRLPVNQLEPSKEKMNKPQGPSLRERFELLWTLYPNKKGKEPAFKSYQKAIKDGVTDEQIKQGIDNYIAEIEAKHTDKQYLRHGSTWFNQRGWEDEYDTMPQAKAGRIQEQLPDWAKDDYNPEENKASPEEIAAIKKKIAAMRSGLNA